MNDQRGVSFNEEENFVSHRVVAPEHGRFSPIGIVMSLGIASSEQGANTVLASLAVVMIVAAAGTYLWSMVPRNQVPPAQLTAELQQMHAVGY